MRRHHRLAQILPVPARHDQEPCVLDQACSFEQVLQPDDVLVAGDEEGGDADRADRVVGHVAEVLRDPDRDCR
jgi:hypothetical protein